MYGLRSVLLLTLVGGWASCSSTSTPSTPSETTQVGPVAGDDIPVNPPVAATEEASPQVDVESGDGEAVAPTEVTPEVTPTDPEAAAEGPAGAPSADAIRGLLLARHVDDLPSRETLESHQDAQETLRWLADHDEQSMVRTRALERLGLWDSDDNVAFLLAHLKDSSLLPQIRTGAVLGLGHLDLEARTEATDALILQVSDTDVRLAIEAVGVLSEVPSARPALDKLAADDSVSKRVRKALGENSP